MMRGAHGAIRLVQYAAVSTGRSNLADRLEIRRPRAIADSFSHITATSRTITSTHRVNGVIGWDWTIQPKSADVRSVSLALRPGGVFVLG
jgi:hypothetical protein